MCMCLYVYIDIQNTNVSYPCLTGLVFQNLVISPCLYCVTSMSMLHLLIGLLFGLGVSTWSGLNRICAHWTQNLGLVALKMHLNPNWWVPIFFQPEIEHTRSCPYTWVCTHLDVCMYMLKLLIITIDCNLIIMHLTFLIFMISIYLNWWF